MQHAFNCATSTACRRRRRTDTRRDCQRNEDRCILPCGRRGDEDHGAAWPWWTHASTSAAVAAGRPRAPAAARSWCPTDALCNKHLTSEGLRLPHAAAMSYRVRFHTVRVCSPTSQAENNWLRLNENPACIVPHTVRARLRSTRVSRSSPTESLSRKPTAPSATQWRPASSASTHRCKDGVTTRHRIESARTKPFRCHHARARSFSSLCYVSSKV